MPLERRRVLYSGQVQGVGFRATCRWLAGGFDIVGYVRNLPDGRVEVVAEGEAAAVQELVEWCHRGPAHARVTAVEDRSEVPEGLTGFAVR